MVFMKSCVVLVLIAVACANSLQEEKSYQLSDDVEVVSNGFQPENDARGEQDVVDTVKGFIQSHDVTFKLPLDAAATVSSRDLDNGVMNFKLKFSSSDIDEGRGKKSKIKKILIPVAFMAVLLVMSFVPLVVGLIGIKTMNVLQVSFFTFMATLANAIYELSKKFAPEHPPAFVAHAHEHWDAAHAAHHRSYDEAELPVVDAQQMAYSAHY